MLGGGHQTGFGIHTRIFLVGFLLMCLSKISFPMVSLASLMAESIVFIKQTP